MKRKILILFLSIMALNSSASIQIKDAFGWLESVCVKWTQNNGYNSFNVYYTGNGKSDCLVDYQLTRNYGSYFRVDIPGLTAGDYIVRIVPVMNGKEQPTDEVTTSPLLVKNHVREGFAFVNDKQAFTPGGYNIDGTVKNDAKIIYVTAANANTVTCDVINERGACESVTGLMNIIKARNKGYDKTPLIIRMIGLIKDSDIEGLKSGPYISFIGANANERRIENITIEGIGDDATAYGYGFYLKRTRGIEVRNFGIMLFGDDGISLEGDNANIWLHNNDFFYGKPGSDKDQFKGDGSIDMKYNSTNVTISFNHFWDSGKTTFSGGAEESNPIYFTYHHNWFDHSDSRNPRLCHAIVHVYNNYYDGNPTMGLLSTENTCAFVEANYYRNCPYPIMINMQGTNYNRWPDGEQGGGIVKVFNNKYEGKYTLITQKDNATSFDAYVVDSRDEKIPETVKSVKGANTYNNFDTDNSFYKYTPDAPEDVAQVVQAYAGRCNGGDLKWSFTNAMDDENTAIITGLKSAETNYQTSFVGIQNSPIPTGITTINTNQGKVTVYDMSGKLILTTDATLYQNAIRKLPAGIYLLGGKGKVVMNR